MRYVLDSNVALKWVLPEAHSDKAIRIRDDFRGGIHQLLSPDVFPIEIAHSLTRAERQGRIAVSDAAKFLHDMLKALPDLHRSLSLLPRACGISSQARVGVYDCLYVALAEREGCELITADDRLVKNLQPRFAFIVALDSFP